MRHSPQIELAAARDALLTARDECPHWDAESDGDSHECCYRVDDARRRYRKAKSKIK